MKKLIIFGTGSFAEVAYFYFQNDSDYEVVAFTVHEKNLTITELLGLPVIAYEKIDETFPPNLYQMFIAVGYKDVNRVRARIYNDAKKRGYRLASYVSDNCTCWTDKIGDNCFIFEDNTIQPFVTIGSNVILWSGNHIGHHSVINDHCFITSHVVVSGNVTVGPYTFLGVNATLRDGITVGKSCVIGAGSLIMRSTNDDELYIEKRTLSADRSSQGVL